MSDKNAPGNVPIEASAAEAIAVAEAPTIAILDSFAEDWFNDAVREARTAKTGKIEEDYNARRREIVFAVCFAESYIVEWAVRARDIANSSEFFSHDSAADKWKLIPGKILGHDVLIPLDKFCTLQNIRNALVHANVSRPQISGQPQNKKPLTTKSKLAKKDAGWAVGVVAQMVFDLHKEAKTSPPDYVTTYLLSGSSTEHRNPC